MKISMICFSLTGLHTAEQLKKGLNEQGYSVTLAKKSKYLEGSIEESVGTWTGSRFPSDDGIIFVGACGIAVRSVAPYVKGKKSDPAVLVIDECGKYVISLLSGHLGGANDLAVKAAQVLHAQPVVTTATDLHHRFAVDVFAKKNHCAIFNMKAAKEVSAALLAGGKVGFYSEFPRKGSLPKGLVECDRSGVPAVSPDEDGNAADRKAESGRTAGKAEPLPLGIAVTIHSACLPFGSTVQVVPSKVTLGMGCRKETDAEAIEAAALECLKRADVYREAAECLASIDLKKDEKGLLYLAKMWKIPFVTFSAEELREMEGDFTPSAFVSSVTGVDNVCERSAAAGAGQGILIEKKHGAGGVTAALAVRKWEVSFE